MGLNITKLQCGECGTRGLQLKDLAGWFRYPYKDFPNVLITESVEMPVCPKCNNVIITADRSHNLEMAIEHSIEGLVQNLLTDVLSLEGMSARVFAKLVGVTPEYISMLLHKKKRASFLFVQLLLSLKMNSRLKNDLEGYWQIERKA